MLQKKLVKGDFTILDSIRGIAALYVVIAHCRGVLWIGGNEFSKIFPRDTWTVVDYGTVGASMLTRLAVEFVIVFFVLSGFSIAHSLSGESTALGFYKRRLIRIYPSYLVALAWAGLVFCLTRALYPEWYDGSLENFAFVRTNQMNSFFNLDVLFKNLFYMPSEGFITPFWSLTYEVIFYILAPLLLMNINVYIVTSLVLFLINFFIPNGVNVLKLPFYIHQFLFVYNIYFVIGVAMYKYFDEVTGFFLRFKRHSLLFLLLSLMLAMYAINFYFARESVYGFLVSAMLGVMLIVYFLQYKVKIVWLMQVGKYSYTLYITHLATIYLYLALYWWLFRPSTEYILSFSVWMPAVFFCLLIAFIQYKLVESRTKEILNRLRYKKDLKSKPITNSGFSSHSIK